MPVAVVSLGPLFWGLLLLVVLAAVAWLAARVRVVSVPLLVAFVVSYLLDPLVARLTRQGLPRTLAILLLVVAFLGVGTGIGFAVAPLVAEQVVALPGALAEALDQILVWLNQSFGLDLPRSSAEVSAAMTDGVDRGPLLQGAVRVLFGGAATVLSAVLGILLVPVFAFFILRDYDRILAWIKSLLPPAHRDAIATRFRAFDDTIGAFIRGQLLVAAILAVLYSIGFWLVGLRLAVVIGVISGIGNMIPYLGTAVGIVLATIVAGLEWQGWLQLLGVYVVFAVVQALEGALITPRIVGGAVGLSPFWVIVAVMVFGELFGFLGVLLAVPLAALLQMLSRVALEHYRESSAYGEEPGVASGGGAPGVAVAEAEAEVEAETGTGAEAETGTGAEAETETETDK